MNNPCHWRFLRKTEQILLERVAGKIRTIIGATKAAAGTTMPGSANHGFLKCCPRDFATRIGQRRGYRTMLKGCRSASSPLQGVRCRGNLPAENTVPSSVAAPFPHPIPQNAAIALTEICPALPLSRSSLKWNFGVRVNLIVRIFLRQPVQPMISGDINSSFPATVVRPTIHTRNSLSDKNTVKQYVIPSCHDNMVEIPVAVFLAAPTLNFSELLLK